MIHISVNGEHREVDARMNVQELLQLLGVPEQVVIVERNLKIVPRDSYSQERLEDGDTLELVRLMGGG